MGWRGDAVPLQQPLGGHVVEIIPPTPHARGLPDCTGCLRKPQGTRLKTATSEWRICPGNTRWPNTTRQTRRRTKL
eukprot:11217347-Lingulodinium_polyedra.AAC.1